MAQKHWAEWNEDTKSGGYRDPSIAGVHVDTVTLFYGGRKYLWDSITLPERLTDNLKAHGQWEYFTAVRDAVRADPDNDVTNNRWAAAVALTLFAPPRRGKVWEPSEVLREDYKSVKWKPPTGKKKKFKYSITGTDPISEGDYEYISKHADGKSGVTLQLPEKKPAVSPIVTEHAKKRGRITLYGSDDEVIDNLAGKDATMKDDVIWASKNLHNKPSVETCPSPRAWTLRKNALKDPIQQKDLNAMVMKITEKMLDRGLTDDGRLLEHIDIVKAASLKAKGIKQVAPEIDLEPEEEESEDGGEG